MTREQLKSLTLVALFGLCTILVSQIWSGISFTQSGPGKELLAAATVTEQLAEIIYPQSYVLSFGGGSHTAVYDDSHGLWQAARPAVLSAFAGKYAEKPVTEAVWLEKRRFRSVLFELPAPVEPALMLQLAGRQEVYAGKVGVFDTLLLVLGEPESVYVGNRAAGQYYVLTGTGSPAGLEEGLRAAEAQDNAEYETVDDHYRVRTVPQAEGAPAQPVNTVMVPRFEIGPRPILRVQGELPEFTGTEEAQATVRQLADAAFGNQFAFVNRLVDVNGAVVFLYGYGEKAFRIHPSGLLDYTEKPDPVLTGRKTDLQTALRLAVTFIGNVGGYPEGLYLADYRPTESKQGYRFRFSYPLEGLPVVSTAEATQGDVARGFDPIEIVVEGEQILFCQRRVGSVEGLIDVTPLWDRVLSLDEVIVKNYEWILPVYMKLSGDTSADTTIQYRLLQSIRSVRLVYCQNTAGDRMTPAWEVDFNGARFLFNIYDGRLMATR